MSFLWWRCSMSLIISNIKKIQIKMNSFGFLDYAATDSFVLSSCCILDNISFAFLLLRIVSSDKSICMDSWSIGSVRRGLSFVKIATISFLLLSMTDAVSVPSNNLNIAACMCQSVSTGFGIWTSFLQELSRVMLSNNELFSILRREVCLKSASLCLKSFAVVNSELLSTILYSFVFFIKYIIYIL